MHTVSASEESLTNDDYPIAQVPTMHLWSENYAFTCYAPGQDIGLASFLGRWTANPHIWREVLAIGLPGDRVACVKNYGSAATRQVASASLFRVEVIEPGSKFRLAYDGPAYERNRHDLARNGFRDGPVELLHVDLTFESSTPVWDMSGGAAHGAEIAGVLHIEQVGTANGTLTFGTERFEITDAFMNRDHSRGTRNPAAFRRHCWAQGWFADEGVSFSVYAIEMFGVDGLAMSNASITVGDERLPARIVDIEMITGVEDERRPFSVTLESAQGRMTFVRRSAPTSLPVAFTVPWDLHHGVVPATPHALTFEEPSIWEWEGRRGIGWSERAFTDQPFPTRE